MVEELTSQVDPAIVHLFVAVALGMFLGLECERLKKSAGVQTFTLTSLLGSIVVAAGNDILLAIRGLLAVVQAMSFGSRRLFDREPSGRGDGADS